MRAWPILLFVPSTALADWPAGTEVYPAAYVDLMPEALDAAEDLVADFVPRSLTVPGISDGDCAGVLGIDLACYEYGVENINVGLIPNAVDLTTGDDTLSVDIDEKYNYECEAVEVCVTAFDPDDDPIEIVFENVGPQDFSLDQGTLELVGFEGGHRVWRQCGEIVTRFTRAYSYDVTAYDLFGDGTRVEDSADVSASSTSLNFPIYTNWIEEPLCFDGSGTLVEADGVSIERAPGCSLTDAETFYCGGGYDGMFDTSIKQFLCDGTDLIEEALYPTCD